MSPRSQGARKVAVVGATGAVGRQLLRLLEDRHFPFDEVVCAASERSAGTTLDVRGAPVTVRAVTDADVFEDVDVALFSAGKSVAAEHAPRAVEAGAMVVDNSSAWRMDADVPLVVAEANPAAVGTADPAGGGRGIVANPNCTTMVAALPLKALHDAFGLTGLTATSLQAASGAGQAGADELEAQLETLLAQREMLYTDGAGAAASVGHDVHAAPLAFNAVPMIGDEADDGTTAEEAKLANESRKILDLPELAVAPTCVRVPVMVGHAVAVRASFADRVGVANAVSSMTGFPGMALVDVPTPLEWAGRDEVAVGRIRADAEDPHVLSFFVVGDNLRKGAALNTVQLAELAVQRDLA